MDTHEEVTLKVATATVEREVHLRVWSLVP